MKGLLKWLEKNKSSLDKTSVKMDVMNVTTKILMKEHERIKGHVKLWETNLRKMEEEKRWTKKNITFWMNGNGEIIYKYSELKNAIKNHTLIF
jgi:hypothetical protein